MEPKLRSLSPFFIAIYFKFYCTSTLQYAGFVQQYFIFFKIAVFTIRDNFIKYVVKFHRYHLSAGYSLEKVENMSTYLKLFLRAQSRNCVMLIM